MEDTTNYKSLWEYTLKKKEELKAENEDLKAQVEALKTEAATLKGQVTAYQFCSIVPYISDKLCEEALK